MSKLYEAQWAAWKTYLWLQSIFDSQKPGEITRNLRTRAHSQSCTEIYLLAENMAETDSDAMLEALRDLPNKAAAAWPTRMLQGPRDREDSTPEATITQVALTRLWQEINETPELIEALFIFGDPQSCKSCFEVTTLAYKEILGYFPTARTITIATLDTAGTFYMALVVRGQNTLLDPTIAFGIQAVLLRLLPVQLAQSISIT
ncbi:hypothetical protein BDV93DRAFT_507352 [Ceratobasidium sp. AG-I]|nr:hypothetical protein BDV93DRAFT_507352 [Ceratobasidium sp. AG-I]